MELMWNKKTTKVFLDALVAGLWNKEPNHPLYDGLTKNEWFEIYQLAFHQTVEAIVGNVIQGLPAALLPPKEILYPWIVRVQQNVDTNHHMNNTLNHLVAKFRSFEIEPILQKGQGIAYYYEQPLLRSVGDIDFCFETKLNYHIANRIIENTVPGFKLTAGYSSNYEFENFKVEHHQKLIQLRNPLIYPLFKRIVQDVSPSYIQILINGKSVTIPAPIINSLMINVHILSHQVGYGVGIKQFCDAARLYHCLNSELDADYLKYFYKKIAALKWIELIHQVLVEMLGLEESKLPFKIVKSRNTEWMKEDILKGGNFSFYNPKYPDIKVYQGRVNRVERLFSSFLKYLPIAPLETISFPIMHVISKVHR
ncbi:nucleotidyltransferase family protein [Sphingobacterium sp. HJSM2_6]|uniref:nucleotidyltransferase family protein n=1 Tax=Sphingobacterium sp. HJSM2_6 TaxID=3366264 RepID=UPI003BCB1998